MALHRVLSPEPVDDLATFVAAGGTDALRRARSMDPSAVRSLIGDAGLRGRGGAGFPTGRKWDEVARRAEGSPVAPTVVVNGAEGEPGSFGDRTLIRANPYKIVEGALIAAHAVGARSVVLALKERFARERRALEQAIADLDESGVAPDVSVELVAGPNHYLLGEESALLEVVAGRPPFPRVAPPFRHGVTEVEIGETGSGTSGLALAGGTDAPPTLVNNVETIAHVVDIVANGADWFRETGTEDSPGTTVFTVTGDVRTAGVAELPLGTPLAEVIATIGGPTGAPASFALSGISSGVVPADRFDVPTTHAAMDAIGSGLGTGGFLVFDESTDPIAVAAGIARFLAVESCGQCEPCKYTGLDIAERLAAIRDGAAPADAVEDIAPLLTQVPVGARCDLGRQHERVIRSILTTFPEIAVTHADGGLASDPVLIAPIVDIVDGRAELDGDHRTKQPDWSHDERWDGTVPADAVDVAFADA